MPPSTPPITAADDLDFLGAPLFPVLTADKDGVGVGVPVEKAGRLVDEDGMGVPVNEDELVPVEDAPVVELVGTDGVEVGDGDAPVV